MFPIAELTQVYTLPGTHIESSVGDGDGQRHAHKGGLYMGRHIIAAFHGMGVSAGILRYNGAHCCLHIIQNRGVSIFIDGKPGRSMLNEDIQQPLIGQILL